MDNYLLEYDDCKDISIKSFLEEIEKCNGKALSDLKVQDLTFHNSKEIYPGQGVYFFRDGTNIIYVGKVSSMSFTERIAKHFDLRHFAWMNGLIKLVCRKILILEITDANLKLAAQYSFQNFNLVLLNFKTRERINRTERLLRSCTGTLNCFKRLKETNLEKLVSEY